MSKQTILLGTAPTGVGGDTPRTAFTKAQSNFDEIYAQFLQRSTMVGSVSQSGGIPTGAVIETGTSGNGTYTKFADGRMICSLLITLPVAINANYASGTLGSTAWGFPAAFVGTPVSLAALRGPSHITFCTPADTNSNTTAAFIVYDPQQGVYTANFVCHFFAIGRWY